MILDKQDTGKIILDGQIFSLKKSLPHHMNFRFHPRNCIIFCHISAIAFRVIVLTGIVRAIHVAAEQFLFVSECFCLSGFQALLALYEVGFLPTGQVHTGNVFFEDGRYILGGFENTLLGYRTSQYAEIKNEGLLDSIDIIMLGRT